MQHLDAEIQEMNTANDMYSSLDAARDVARGACLVAWPADEPYTEPVLAPTITNSVRLPTVPCTAETGLRQDQKRAGAGIVVG